VNIRTVTEADLEQITRIYGYHVREGLASFEEEAPSLADMRSRFRSLRESGFPCLVAVDDDEPDLVLGYAYAGPYRTRPAYRFSVENSVYVDSNAHRRGVGAGLLGALIAHCESGPWRQMIAIIGDSANTPSIALHETMGFSHVGTIAAIGYKHGRWVDSVIMQRRLGSGDTTHPEQGGG